MNSQKQVVRIEAFKDKRAAVYGYDTRGCELLAGHLEVQADGFHFIYKRSTARGITRWIRDFWSSPEFQTLKMQYEAQQAAEAAAQDSADFEFRQEVIAELVAEGKAAHVAANLTNTPAKLMAEARRVGVI